MRVRPTTLGGIVAAIVLAGCGGSGHTTAATTATSSSTAALPPGAPPALRGVAGRVLTAGELAGFAPQGRRALGINAASWTHEEQLPPAQGASETARLQRLGFIAGVRERLTPAGGGPAEGLSVVEQLRAADAARAELAAEVSQVHAHGRVTAFAVPGIPGARGFASSGAQSSGVNVAFVDGSYYYLVGAGWPAGYPHPPTQAALIAAAESLYRRVHT